MMISLLMEDHILLLHTGLHMHLTTIYMKPVFSNLMKGLKEKKWHVDILVSVQ
jgi:hypothetical protein